MSNPYGELYAALWGVLSSSDDVREIADIVSQGEGGIETPRRKLDEPERVRVFLVPQAGGTLKNVSSTHSRLVERFAVVGNAAFISHADAMSLKLGIVKAIWANRTLGLAFVERTDVDSVSRRPTLGTHVLDVNAGKGTSLTWTVEVMIRVTMYLDRTDLPMS